MVVGGTLRASPLCGDNKNYIRQSAVRRTRDKDGPLALSMLCLQSEDHGNPTQACNWQCAFQGSNFPQQDKFYELYAMTLHHMKSVNDVLQYFVQRMTWKQIG
jgi:hypothetical protein